MNAAAVVVAAAITATIMAAVMVTVPIATKPQVHARRTVPIIMTAASPFTPPLNEGMLAIWRGQIHEGADAVRLLAQLSRASKRWADRLYPALRMGRAMALKILGRRSLRS